MKMPKILPAFIILVVILGTVAYAVRDKGGDFDFFDDLFGSDLFGAKQQATIELTVIYDNGDEKDFSLTELSVSSLLITEPVTDRVIDSIRANVKVKIAWEKGVYKSQSTSGVLKLFNEHWTAAVSSKNFNYDGDLPMDQWVTIASVTYSNFALEQWTKDGENSLRLFADLTVTIRFSDDSTDKMDGSGAVNFKVNKGVETGGALTLVNVSVERTLLS